MMKKIWIVAILLLPAFAQAQNSGNYKVRLDKPQQVIWGLGVEIQNDAIGSGNSGLPNKVVAIPHDLIPSERKRLYEDMLKGFRYCRLAMGLYFRGLDSSKSRIVERYPNQMKDLKELIKKSGIEGISMEYWSPAPAWKSTDSYLGGTLKSDDPVFLDKFGDALVDDIKYMQKNGIKISMWGLQNEPNVGSVSTLTLGKVPQSYSHSHYEPALYYKAFKAIAPKIRKAAPNSMIISDSSDGNSGKIGKLIQQDSALLSLVDAWVYHRIGDNSNQVRKDVLDYTTNTFGKPVFNNEFEYQHPTNAKLCINTAQSVMDWLTFANAPTWFWLHALKPTYNVEASGYSLGFWRPQDDDDFTHSPQIKKGEWDYNPNNFNALAGFLKYMPWNSQRFTVDEDVIRDDHRIMAYQTPKGKLVMVFTNRTETPFTFRVDPSTKKTFKGYRYTPSARDTSLGSLKSEDMQVTLPAMSIEFWVQQ